MSSAAARSHGPLKSCWPQGALAVAVGKCNHKQVCARCCLRMRLCYKDTTCPLCKAEQTEVRSWPCQPTAPSSKQDRLQHEFCHMQVALALWQAEHTPDWAHLDAQRQTLWSHPRWAPGVLVQPVSLPSGPDGFPRPLHAALQVGCWLCKGARAHTGPPREPAPDEEAACDLHTILQAAQLSGLHYAGHDGARLLGVRPRGSAPLPLCQGAAASRSYCAQPGPLLHLPAGMPLSKQPLSVAPGRGSGGLELVGCCLCTGAARVLRSRVVHCTSMHHSWRRCRVHLLSSPLAHFQLPIMCRLRVTSQESWRQGARLSTKRTLVSRCWLMTPQLCGFASDCSALLSTVCTFTGLLSACIVKLAEQPSAVEEITYCAAGSHKACPFCQETFYDADTLFEHNRSQHFWCTLCTQQQREVCFREGAHLTQHLR